MDGRTFAMSIQPPVRLMTSCTFTCAQFVCMGRNLTRHEADHGQLLLKIHGTHYGHTGRTATANTTAKEVQVVVATSTAAIAAQHSQAHCS